LSFSSIMSAFDKNHPPLNQQQSKIAVEDLFCRVKRKEGYPQVVRSSETKTVLGQTIGNVSFELFKEPKIVDYVPRGAAENVRPRKVNHFGFFKVHGAFSNDIESLKHAKEIIEEYDSKRKILQCPMGQWLPIVSDDAYVEKEFEIDDNEFSSALKGELAEKKRQEERKIKQELQERKSQIESANEEDEADDPTKLDYYVTQRVSEMYITDEVRGLEKKLEQTKKTQQQVRKMIKYVESHHPSYADQWINRMNEVRAERGIPDLVVDEHQFDELEAMSDTEDTTVVEKYNKLLKRYQKSKN
jgi:hypothetical protein